MPESIPSPIRAEDLIAQDHAISDTQLETFKMNLMTSLAKLEARAQAVRRAIIISLALTVTCVIGVIPLEAFQLAQVPWVATLWVAMGGVSFTCAAVLLVLYNERYRQAINRGRWEMQTAAMADLQRELRELTQQLRDMRGEA
jgi:hypothetical protein